ncbi:MAG: carboxypeptidase regulatory-like domain-containing protein [Candidatus Magnetomorum sp.]|nr:carboxypeptidase regulatory-like domain-containing protein [Candidatus Magnetomorum sp.]
MNTHPLSPLKTQTLILIFTAVFFMNCLPICLAEEADTIPTGVLHGKITDKKTGESIANARVEAGNFITYSEPNGYYRFSFIPEGTYDIAVLAARYKTMLVQNIRVIKQKTMAMNFSLTQNLQPIVHTGSASKVTCQTAMFNGAVYPNGLPTTAYFEYGTSQTYGMQTAHINAGNSWDQVSVNSSLVNLVSETSYHFRLVAENQDGATYGNDQTFSTDVPILSFSEFQTVQLPSGQSRTESFLLQNHGCGKLLFALDISDARPITPSDNHQTYPDIVVSERMSGVIDAGSVQAIALMYTAKNLPYGQYEVEMTVNHNALNYPNPLVLTIPVQITSPKISVHPDRFNFVVEKGKVKKDMLTIANQGNTDLSWRMNVMGMPISRDMYPSEYYIPIDKDEIDFRVGESVGNHYGGPDLFGYMWSDSTSDGGPTYDWTDISKSGRQLADMKDDDYSAPLDIGFSFPFYGQKYDQFYIASNGFIGFGPTTDYASHSNMPVPGNKTPQNLIACLWDDLSLEGAGSTIYYRTQGDRLIVQFEKMGRYGYTGTATCQIIIDKTGLILLQYKSFTDGFNRNSCTVGIENADGSDGLEVAFNINYLSEQLAIRFEPNRCSWLKIFQTPSGRIGPGESIDVSIGADTAYLSQDHYQCNLTILSDDILFSEIVIPVELDVVASSPIIDVEPERFVFELMENEDSHQKMTIMNQGSEPLVWNMTASCGPGAKSGYSWMDSDMTGGPMFDWVDISKTGKKIADLKDDGFAGPFSIGFSFDFYGETYTTFYVSSNGFIAFGSNIGLTERINKPIPETRSPDNILAWFWDDLMPREGAVYYKTINDKLIISFLDYGQFGTSGTLTAQVVLHDDGSIIFQYHHFRDGFKTDTATIGIESKQGTEGVQVAFNNDYLHDLHAIRFQNNPCAWLSTDPTSGIVASNATESVTVHATAKEVQQGEYNAVLTINSNDKSHNPIDIPVRLIVKGQSQPPQLQSTIVTPQSGDHIYSKTFPITGTAKATELETVVRVEISFDGGNTWNLASGTNDWRYEWTVPATSGAYSICVRATGESGDIETELTDVSVNVTSRAASRILVMGQSISVNDVLFQVKGVGYAPTPIGQDPEVHAPYGDYFTSGHQAIYQRDLPLLRIMGSNTIRLWGWQPTADHMNFLDTAYNDGVDPIYVVVGFWINSGLNIDPKDPSNQRDAIKQNFLDMVRIHMNHPAILMWCIGNELNADWMYGSDSENLFSLINDMAKASRLLEGRTYHPVTTALMDENLINTIKLYDSSMTDLSVWGANIYRGSSFGDVFTSYAGASQKPLIILEFGIDALDNKTQREYEADGLSDQEEYARALWAEIDQNKTLCVGGSIMAYSDEWWKGKHATDPLCKDNDPEHHGFCGYATNAHPDSYANEEWWGIMRTLKNGKNIDQMKPRSIYYELQKLWNYNPIPPEENKIIPLECEKNDNLGRAVAIWGDYAIAGANGDDEKGGNAGAAYMIRFNGQTWVKEQKILPEDGDVNDYFGCSVAISNTDAILGAYGKDDKGSKAGAAYIYQLSSQGWTTQQKLLADDAVANDYFGYAVDIDGDFAIIGAYGDDDKGSMSGSAYIFKREGKTWTQHQKLIDELGERNDLFGFSVAISGNYAIIGAYRDDDKGDSSGTAIIFKYDKNTWVKQTRLVANDGKSNDYFGYDVAISGEYAAIGSYRSDAKGMNVGSVYIYQYDKGNWNYHSKIVPNDGSTNDYFGFSLDLQGTRMIIGAYGDDDKGPSSGSAYLYAFNQSQWEFQKKYIASEGQSYDYFGYDVSISDRGVIMGAYGHDEKGSMAGAVYIFGQTTSNDTRSVLAHSVSRSSAPSDNTFTQLFSGLGAQDNVLSHKNADKVQDTAENLLTGQSFMTIDITDLPPIGNRLKNLEGRVFPFDSSQYAVQVAIYVNDQWRIKPGKHRQESMWVKDDGSFSCDITTEPQDHLAKKIAVFVVPVGLEISEIEDISRISVVGIKIIERE